MKMRVLKNLAVACIAGTLLADGALAAVKFTAAPYLRLRYELWQNIFDMNSATGDDRAFFRFKESVWGKLDVRSDFSAFAKLTNESRAYVKFEGGNAAYNINELVFDNLYADFRNVAGYPVDVRIGRQDFLPTLYGEGFILADGTPLDGSRTFYFNAGRASWRINKANSLDALYIKNKEYDDILPVGNEIDGKQALNASDEEAYGLYHKADPSKAVHWENYGFYKREDGGGPALQAQETRLTTLGTFVRMTDDPFTFRGQAAYQLGDYGTNQRTGFGGYAFTDITFDREPLKPSGTFGFVYLSGDDPSTAANEAWDPLFSRYPLWSELYTLAYASESGLSYWTNLQMLRLGAAVQPTAKSKVTLYYSLLYANQSPAGAGTGASIFDTGKDRGRLAQLRGDYTFNRTISTYGLVEYFTPGGFYRSQDDAVFVRVEMQFKF